MSFILFYLFSQGLDRETLPSFRICLSCTLFIPSLVLLSRTDVHHKEKNACLFKSLVWVCFDLFGLFFLPAFFLSFEPPPFLAGTRLKHESILQPEYTAFVRSKRYTKLSSIPLSMFMYCLVRRKRTKRKILKVCPMF